MHSNKFENIRITTLNEHLFNAFFLNHAVIFKTYIFFFLENLLHKLRLVNRYKTSCIIACENIHGKRYENIIRKRWQNIARIFFN